MTNRRKEAGLGGLEALDLLNVRPVVNCMGTYTDLGGSVLAADVWQALTELNLAYVHMPDLITAAGALIAKIAGAEAGRVTPGASAALALAVGATMTGLDGKRWEQLPDTTGLKNEALIAASHLSRYHYAVCARMSGATLVPAGDEESYDEGALIDAIGARTACILVPAHLLDGFDGVEKLRSLVAASHARGVPVVVDAAYMIDPPDRLHQYAGSGADLVCFSAKYFYGPNSGGFVIGQKALMAAVEGLDFTRFESGPFRKFGRAFKMNRYDVVATVLALRAWIETDHEARWRRYADMARTMAAALPAADGVEIRPRFFTLSEELEDQDLSNCVALRFAGGEAAVRKVAERLEAEDPVIAAITLGDELVLVVEVLQEGQDRYVVERVSQALRT